MEYINAEVKREIINADSLLEEIKPIIKDMFVANVQKCSDGFLIKFPSGQTFTLAIWENNFFVISSVA